MSDQTRTKIIGLIVIVLVTTVGTVGAAAYNARANQQIAASASQPNIVSAPSSSQNTTPTATASSSSSTTPTTPGANTYKDGTYTANGSFYTPDGTEQIGVTLTLASDKITAVSIDSSSIYSGTSAAYTDRFSSGISSAVVGKNIADVQVYRISGASLTPIGFNNAVATIENEAKA